MFSIPPERWVLDVEKTFCSGTLYDVMIYLPEV